MHLLYLDDEPGILTSLRRALSPRGIRVTCFESAESLLAIAPSSDADVILLDYHLGETDGLTVFRALRAKGVTTPCVLYTGKAGEKERTLAYDLGFAAVVQKPMPAGELAALLRKVVRDSGRATATSRKTAQPITLDPETGEVSDGTLRVEVRGRQRALLLLLVRSESGIRRQDIAPRLFGVAYPESSDLAHTMDDRISKVVQRLRKALGSFERLLDCQDGRVRLSAKITIAKSGTYQAVHADDTEPDVETDADVEADADVELDADAS